MAVVAIAWVLAFLLPTLLVPGLPAYEHRVYLPLIGVAVATATMARGTPRVATGAAVAALLVAFTAVTLQRQEAFRDPFAFWTDAARDPRFGAVAHVNLGQLHEAAGRPADARREYLRALERDPATPKAHNNLGVVLMQLEQPELAVRHFQEETARHPWNADAWFNLGLWAEMRGDASAARGYYERAIRENPAYRPAYEKLGRMPPP
jgi:tetratricopeptide (TPR) repeat protein